MTCNSHSAEHLYLCINKSFHKASSLEIILHIIFIKKVSFIYLKFLSRKPPTCFGIQKLFQEMVCILWSIASCCQTKALYNFSISFNMEFKMCATCIIYMGMALMTDFDDTTLLAMERHFVFQPTHLSYTFFIM